ncbi:MAG: ferrous iron transporter B [Demequinaceae bacterium]|nr:ferrous iron transporter B [Demequinaceae bacterium]
MTTERPVLIIGNPNVGKSTLFNTLTGARQHTVNAPGTTVELVKGTWVTPHGRFEVTDLPGTYSLIARSPDECVVDDAIAGAAPGTVGIVVVDATSPSRSLYLLAQVVEEGCPAVVALTMNDLAEAHHHRVDASALSATIGVPVVEVDTRRRHGTDALAEAVLEAAAAGPALKGLALKAKGSGDGGESLDDTLTRTERLFEWVREAAAAIEAVPRTRRTLSDPIDRLLLAPWTGIPIFLAVAWALFEVATRVTAPLVHGVMAFFSGPVSSGGSWLLERVGADGGWLEGLLVDGVILGVGTVASFIPILALIFAALGVLEASGYMARVAVVADRVMSSMGLDGRAVLPLMVGFGCNVPALAATRVMPDARQRLLTGLLIPFTSCSARLTVYIVLAEMFFPDHAGTAVFLLHVLSVVLVVAVGLLLRGTVLRDVRREPLAMIMPAYQWPLPGVLTRSILTRVWDFVRGAGPIIVAALVALWLAAAVPVRGGHAIGDVPVEDSLYGAGARGIAPVLEPMGLGDWHLAASLVSGLAAKEVTVAALAQSYAVEAPTGSPPTALVERVRETVTETSGGHPAAAGFAFMVLVLVYAPCLATAAEQRRLFGWRWAGGALAMHLVLGWLLATLAFQVGRLL